MNRRFGETPFRELLANSLQDDKAIEACASALDGLLEKSAKILPELLIFARLARDSGFIDPVPMLPPMKRLADLAGGLAVLPTELLDLLAWQLHVESYNCGVSLQAKREMIQASLLLHRRNGTPWSVRHALETLLRVPAEIREWFSYGGRPYFFRARLNVTGVFIDIRWLLSAFQIVFDYKNVRSWLEWLETFSETVLEIRTGIGIRGNVRDRQMLFFPDAPMPETKIRTGMNITSRTSTSYGLTFPSEKPEGPVYTGVNLQVRSISQISGCKE